LDFKRDEVEAAGIDEVLELVLGNLGVLVMDWSAIVWLLDE